MAVIRFFVEDVSFKVKEKNKLKKWLQRVADTENLQIDELIYIFCSDEYLYNINVSYLNHHTYTDIITFDQGEEEGTINGEIYISIDRVKENAAQLHEPFEKEFKRVISHGLLHLCGYKDKNKKDAETMRRKEEDAISMYES